ncbi:hypothetical protein RIF29_09572 [Crotalaria pallida]|uniref:Uncharacterized protein n=1 Tax=Crotalaria pallida TaxID=3830 RepID=A0AAN9FUU9_CROPI
MARSSNKASPRSNSNMCHTLVRSHSRRSLTKRVVATRHIPCHDRRNHHTAANEEPVRLVADADMFSNSVDFFSDVPDEDGGKSALRDADAELFKSNDRVVGLGEGGDQVGIDVVTP